MKTESTEYIRGLKDGVICMCGGRMERKTVGTCGTTLKQALINIDKEITVRVLPPQPEQGQVDDKNLCDCKDNPGPVCNNPDINGWGWCITCGHHKSCHTRDKG